MKKILVFFICVLIVGLMLMSYAVGYNAAIMIAEPYIVEIPQVGDDYFQVFVDYDGESHEYRGNIY